MEENWRAVFVGSQGIFEHHLGYLAVSRGYLLVGGLLRREIVC